MCNDACNASTFVYHMEGPILNPGQVDMLLHLLKTTIGTAVG